MPIDFREKLTLFFKDLATVDKVGEPKYHKAVCRECEIVGAGFMFTIPFYMWHLVRTGRLNAMPGRVIGVLTTAVGLSLIMRRDEASYERFKRQQALNESKYVWIQKRTIYKEKD